MTFFLYTDKYLKNINKKIYCEKRVEIKVLKEIHMKQVIFTWWIIGILKLKNKT